MTLLLIHCYRTSPCHSPAAPIPDNTVTSLRRRLNVMKEVFGDSDDDGAAGGGGGGDDARRKGRFKYDVHNILTPPSVF